MNKLRLISAISVCFITACAPPKMTPDFTLENKYPPHGTEQLSKNTTKTQASTVSSWEISGAMAARNTKKGWTASLNWVQQGPNRYQMRLFGPLGGGTVLIERNGGAVTYVDGPKRVSSRNADELLEQQTGIRLPVQDLYYWVRGLPAPGAVQSSQHDQSSHLISLSQAGYTINYTNYTTVNNVDLPGKIQLQGHGVIIKLAIKRWSV